MEKEKIQIDFEKIQELCGGTDKKKKGRVFPAAVSFAAAILIFTSLTVHTALLLKAVQFCKKDGEDILLSMVIPKKSLVVKKAETKKEEKEQTPAPPEKKEEVPKYINCDLSSDAENAMAVMNETSYEPELEKLFARKKPIPAKNEIYEKYGEGAPLFLIYHTHTTEAYAECAETGYRTENKELNVVAVGSVITEKLQSEGIGVVHLTEIFDTEDFNTAYDRSTQAVRETLRENPSIQYVLDIHRDSVDRNGEYVKCMSEINGEGAAQLMLVCGTDAGGSGHESWQDNLTVSLQLQSMLWQKYPTLMRPIDLKEASFYQDTRAGALLVEFGASGNSLSEAKRSAELFAEALAEYAEK